MKSVAAVILAAGESSRFGAAKQHAQIDGETLVQRAIRVALGAGCEPVLVVQGAHQLQCRAPGVRIVPNEQWSRGIGTSIRAGVQQVPADCAAVMLMTCDQPLITSDGLRKLIAANAAMAAAEYAGTLGIPACFARSEFPHLLALADDEGAKKLILSGAAARVRMDEAAADVDTPADLAQLDQPP